MKVDILLSQYLMVAVVTSGSIDLHQHNFRSWGVLQLPNQGLWVTFDLLMLEIKKPSITFAIAGFLWITMQCVPTDRLTEVVSKTNHSNVSIVIQFAALEDTGHGKIS